MPVSHRRSGMVHRSPALRRRTAWATSQNTPNSLAAGTKTSQDLLSGFEVAGASTLGITVGRTHTRLFASFSTTDTGPGFYAGWIRLTAALAGANVPDPANTTQQEDDWSLISLYGPGNSISTTISGTSELCGWDIDIRSKRKLTQMGDKYFFVISNVGSASFNWSQFTRVLCYLP